MALRPRMVSPPGVVTLSISLSGCEPGEERSEAAPMRVWRTIFCASCGRTPSSTPPSTAARM